jgi:hypothetical protein
MIRFVCNRDDDVGHYAVVSLMPLISIQALPLLPLMPEPTLEAQLCDGSMTVQFARCRRSLLHFASERKSGAEVACR